MCCRDANKAGGEAECFIGHRGSAPSASAIRKIKYEACCRDANKARGEAECFIGHRGSAPSALFYI